jgi:anti-sigma factor RsiW
MTITRKVVLDLLPLYAANELSEDSRQIVEEFLKTDPELAGLVKKMAANGLRGTPPAPPSREAELRAFIQTKRIMLVRTVVWVFAIALLAAIALFFFSR